MPEQYRVEVAHAMIVYGGSFVKALGNALLVADPDNTLIIIKSFPTYWDRYIGIAIYNGSIKADGVLYDVAKRVCHDQGMPWTDPRTGITHPPPKTREPEFSIPCGRCSKPIYSSMEFVVPNDVWNAVIRLGGEERDDEYLCEACFRKAVEVYVRSKSQ